MMKYIDTLELMRELIGDRSFTVCYNDNAQMELKSQNVVAIDEMQSSTRGNARKVEMRLLISSIGQEKGQALAHELMQTFSNKQNSYETASFIINKMVVTSLRARGIKPKTKNTWLHEVEVSAVFRNKEVIK